MSMKFIEIFFKILKIYSYNLLEFLFPYFVVTKKNEKPFNEIKDYLSKKNISKNI